jgi:hypothetical protein
LAPELVDSIGLFLYFKEAIGIFGREEEVVKDFVAVVKRRLDSDSADVVIDVELVEEVFASLCLLVEVS